MKKTIGYLLIVIAVAIFGFRVSKGIEFKQNVSGYLKRASNANTIDLAEQELTRSLQYLEEKKMTTGYTSVLYKTPDEDVDFWYRNLKASQHELQTLTSSSALEKTNVLMKLRETLQDTPKGISAFPNNKLWTVLMFFSVIGCFIGVIILTVEYENEQQKKNKKVE